MKKVSIIISTFNRRLALEKSIQSALDQEYGNIEVLVVDDGSTDDTESYIANRFTDDRLRYIRLPQNRGATVARNTGLDEALGEYTLIWDSDDELDSTAVSTLVTVHEKYPYSTVVSAPTRVMVNGEPISIPSIPEGVLSPEVIICALMPKYKLVRMVHVPTGGAVRYRGRNLDFMVNSELAECGTWIHTQQPLGTHYLLSDENSLTRKRRVPNVDRSMERAPHLITYLDRFGDRLCASCPSRYAAHAYGASLGLILLGKKKEARTILRRATKVYPRLIRCWLVYGVALLPGGTSLVKKLFTMRA